MKDALQATAQEEAVTTMKAVRIHDYGTPEVLQYEDAPRPRCGRGDILICVYAAGVNPIDAKIRQGATRKGVKYALPFVLGFDVSGVVEAVGSDVTSVKEGDEVFGRLDFESPGAYAEYAIGTQSEIALKPRCLDHIQTAAVPLAALTAWQGLFEVGKLQSGQTVLIHGAAGGVGHFAVQLAKWKGAHVIATASGDGVGLVRSLGGDEVIDYKAIDFEQAVCSVDVVLDVIGGETQKRSWQTLKKGGVLVSTVGIADHDAPATFGVRGESFLARADAQQLKEIARIIDEGRVRPIVSAVLPLEEARMAHEMIQTGSTRGKIVLKVRN